MRTSAAGTRSRTLSGCGRGWGRGPDMVKDWLRTRSGRGRGLFSDWTRSRTGEGHGLQAGLWCGHSASKPRPNRDHFADTESFVGEGVRLVLVKCLQLKSTKRDKCARYRPFPNR
jgi:hypothetical protein